MVITYMKGIRMMIMEAVLSWLDLKERERKKKCGVLFVPFYITL